jgi:hypothetical protein
MRFFAIAWVLPWVALGVLRRRTLDAVWQVDPSRERATLESVRIREAFNRT